MVDLVYVDRIMTCTPQLILCQLDERLIFRWRFFEMLGDMSKVTYHQNHACGSLLIKILSAIVLVNKLMRVNYMSKGLQ